MYRLLVRGDWAFFSRPGFVSDCVSYDVLSPLAARGILDSIHWRPAVRWMIDRIKILNPVDLVVRANNDVGSAGDGEGASILALRCVAYLIDAQMVLTASAGERDSISGHKQMFERRVRKQQPFRQPYFGVRDCPAEFRLLDEDEQEPVCPDQLRGERDWGWLAYDLDDRRHPAVRYFRARSVDGVIAVPGEGEVALYG